MSLENKVKEEKYDRVDPASGVRYTIKRPSLAKRILSRASNTLLAGVLAATSVLGYGCDGHKRRVTPQPTNNAPVITTTAPTSSLEGSLYNYDVDATDAEGDAISYSLDTAPLWASINATSGLITGTPTGYSANTPESFSVRATDSKGAFSTQSFVVNVTNTGTVSGNVADHKGTGLLNIIVDLYNASYPQGSSGLTATTDSSGNFTINNVPNGTYTFECGDSFNQIYIYRESNVSTTGNSMSKNGIGFLRGTPTSSNSAYHDSLGNPSRLAQFKEMTRTRTSDSPAGGPHRTKNWGTQYPIRINFNISGMPSTDIVGPGGAGGSDLKPDYQNALEDAIGEVNTRVPSTLQTTSSTSSNGIINLSWPSSIAGGFSGLTTYSPFNGDGSFDVVNIQVITGLSYSVARAVILHEIWAHALDNGLGSHTADGSTYIRAATGSVTTTHADEGIIAEINKYFLNGTDIDRFIDQ